MPEPKRIAIVISLVVAFKWHLEIGAGVTRYARRRGWKYDLLRHGRQICEAGRHKVRYDGIVGRIDPALARFARARRIPVVNVWFSSPVTGVPLVAPDYERVGVMAAEHLLSRGFRRFGFLGDVSRTSRTLERGFRAAVGDSSAWNALEVPESDTDDAVAYKNIEANLLAWLGKLQRPVGVLTSDDVFGRLLVNMATLQGISVPDELAVVGMGNEGAFCQIGEPSLTSIDSGFDRVGYRAGELLDELMSGEQPQETSVLLPPGELVPRGSTDGFASEDPLVGDALRYMAANCHRPITVADVVAKLSTCGRTLARHFAQERGCRPIDEIMRMRIARAKRLLLDGEMPIKQVAKQCGFAGATQFGMAFRRLEKVSPKEFRGRG